MMKRCIIIALACVASMTVAAQGFDPVRAALWEDCSFKSKKALEAQEKMQMLMMTGHIWIKEEEDAIYDFQKEFNDYLDTFHDVISMAAEIYGLYYEVSKLATNIKSVNKAVSDAPANALAVAFSTRRNKFYRNIIKNGIDLAKDIRTLCFGESKLTESERDIMLHNIRPKLRNMNKQIRMLALALRYTSFVDVWREITHRAEGYNSRTRRQIVDQCMEDWKSNAGM